MTEDGSDPTGDRAADADESDGRSRGPPVDDPATAEDEPAGDDERAAPAGDRAEPTESGKDDDRPVADERGAEPRDERSEEVSTSPEESSSGGGGGQAASAERVEADEGSAADVGAGEDAVPPDVRSYDRFQKMDRASYDRVNEFLRDRTYITAREWAIARLCADFRTATGVEMTKIGKHLPELVPFMTDTYSPQAVNQARSAFEEKVRMAGATFLYGAMSGFFTADELDDLMYEVTEVAKFLLEVEGVELAVEEELAAEDRISSVMREVREASEQLRYDDVECPHCGEAFRPAED